MNTNNKFIGAGATESKDRIAALLLMPTSRANPFAAVGGTRHDTRSGVLAHIELSTAAFQFTELHCHSGQTRAVYGGTRSAITGQTQQPNAVQIAIT